MSKAIYDEVLEILLDSFKDPQDEDNDCFMFNFRQIIKIEKVVIKAQKQEKLLNKIKEIIDKEIEAFDILEEAICYNEIKKLMIKELEKE